MAKYEVTHEDGRTTQVFAPDEARAKKQATHQEMTRIVIAGKRERAAGPDASIGISAVKIKE